VNIDDRNMDIKSIGIRVFQIKIRMTIPPPLDNWLALVRKGYRDMQYANIQPLTKTSLTVVVSCQFSMVIIILSQRCNNIINCYRILIKNFVHLVR
jgi:hypothetical protein